MPPPQLELVSMILSSMPSPPTPMLAGKEVEDEITIMCGEHKIANAHDLWGMLLLTAMSRQQDEENRKRAEGQKSATAKLFVQLKMIHGCQRLSHVDEVKQVYDAFCEFTRENLRLLSTKADVRFLPIEAILREDRIHIATCHHAAAQDILFGVLRSDGDGQEKRTAEVFSEYSYTSLIMRQYARIVESFESEKVASEIEDELAKGGQNKVEILDDVE